LFITYSTLPWEAVFPLIVHSEHENEEWLFTNTVPTSTLLDSMYTCSRVALELVTDNAEADQSALF